MKPKIDFNSMRDFHFRMKLKELSPIRKEIAEEYQSDNKRKEGVNDSFSKNKIIRMGTNDICSKNPAHGIREIINELKSEVKKFEENTQKNISLITTKLDKGRDLSKILHELQNKYSTKKLASNINAIEDQCRVW